MQLALQLTLALLLGGFGCWLSGVVLPAGAPRTAGQVLSVMLGFGCFALPLLP